MSFILKLNAQELTFQNELHKSKLEIAALLSRVSQIRKKGDELIFPCPIADLVYQMQAVLERFYSLETPPISEDNIHLFEDTLFIYERMVEPLHQVYFQTLSTEKMNRAQMTNKRTESSEDMISPTITHGTTTTTRSSAYAATTIQKASHRPQEFLDKLTYQLSNQRQKIAQRNHANNSRHHKRKRGSISPRQLSAQLSTSPTSGKAPRTVPRPCDAEHKYGCPPGVGLYEMYMRGTNKHTTN